MARLAAIIAAVVGAGLFSWTVPLLRLFDALQPLITALSIMVAAVFVRLNRGMPTLEWKSVDPSQREQLTTRIVSLTQEYALIIVINAAALLGLVTLSVIGKADVAALWPVWAQRTAAGVIGGLGGLCIARIAYVVWRDIDVVKLQKCLIDGTAARELSDTETKSAEDKVLAIRAAGLRHVDIASPKAWDE